MLACDDTWSTGALNKFSTCAKGGSSSGEPCRTRAVPTTKVRSPPAVFWPMRPAPARPVVSRKESTEDIMSPATKLCIHRIAPRKGSTSNKRAPPESSMLWNVI